MYYALATNQDYMKTKVSVFVALGPVTKISHSTSAIFQFAKHFYDEIDDALWTLGIYEILGKSWFTSTAMKLFCGKIPQLCTLLEKLTVSSNPATDDLDRFAILMDHEPNGSSAQSIMLYLQGMREDRFQVYAPDYNKVIHSKKTTDLIPLENITEVPIAMFVGKADKLADPEDAAWARQTIGNSVVRYQMVEGGHMTFFIAKDMDWFT
jgi:hypothetical protein